MDKTLVSAWRKGWWCAVSQMLLGCITKDFKSKSSDLVKRAVFEKFIETLHLQYKNLSFDALAFSQLQCPVSPFFCCFLHLICKFKKPSHVVALDKSSKSLNCSRRLEQSITWHWWSINTFSSLANAQDSTRSFSRMIIRAWLRVAKRFSAKLSSLETHNFRVKGSPRIGS